MGKHFWLPAQVSGFALAILAPDVVSIGELEGSVCCAVRRANVIHSGWCVAFMGMPSATGRSLRLICVNCGSRQAVPNGEAAALSPSV